MKIIGSTGDKDPFAYGGGVVVDDDGDVSWIFWNVGDEPDSIPIRIYRVPVPDDVLTYYDWADWPAIRKFIDLGESEIQALNNGSVLDRVVLLDAIQSYHGPNNLDDCPNITDEAGLRDQWETEYDDFLKGPCQIHNTDKYDTNMESGFSKCGWWAGGKRQNDHFVKMLPGAYSLKRAKALSKRLSVPLCPVCFS